MAVEAQEEGRKRKPHTKSRKGCKNCKLRRVKVSLIFLTVSLRQRRTNVLYSVTRASLNVKNASTTASLAITMAAASVYRGPMNSSSHSMVAAASRSCSCRSLASQDLRYRETRCRQNQGTTTSLKGWWDGSWIYSGRRRSMS